MNAALIQVVGVAGIELATVNSTIQNVNGEIKCINDFTVVLADAQGDLSLYPICSLSGFRVGMATPVAIPTGCNIRNTCSRCANTVKNSLCNLQTSTARCRVGCDDAGIGRVESPAANQKASLADPDRFAHGHDRRCRS